MDLCLARIERLTNRIRPQDWYHELSDQESEDEIDRMVGDEPRSTQERRGIRRVRAPTADIDQWLNQFREEFQTMSQVGTSSHSVLHYQPREERRATLEKRVEHFRNEYVEAVTETAMSFISIRQEFQGRGALESRSGFVSSKSA